MKQTLPMVRMCWGMMNELLNGSHQVEGRKYRYIQERFTMARMLNCVTIVSTRQRVSGSAYRFAASKKGVFGEIIGETVRVVIRYD